MARIIIAEDDPVVASLVTALLEKEGHAVGRLEDGVDVARVAAAKRPDLLILDCGMPGKSGLDALREIRAGTLGTSLPVLILTGRTGARDELIAMQAGANDYLRKPVDPDLLAVRVEALVAGYWA
ncbi:response regulator transcription factor [Sphingomicrobium nitratireducens]|uniref:response regulator transcription factor n=1 Tax=Sphingomicrobium nitratireducens TaxID=2964666 RepID=UPI0022409694|nr:response regulator transcription factor [Sphingomicrobium nitratireducens]